MIENIQKLISEDTMEMIYYLQTEKIEGSQDILDMLENEEEAEKLNLFILEESKLFGGFAYKHSTFEVNVLDENKKVIFEAIKNKPALQIIHDAYVKWVDLKDVNPALSEEEAKSLREELLEFLSK